MASKYSSSRRVRSAAALAVLGITATLSLAATQGPEGRGEGAGHRPSDVGAGGLESSSSPVAASVGGTETETSGRQRPFGSISTSVRSALAWAGVASDGSPPEADVTPASAASSLAPTCSPGPSRVSDMETVRGGYLKARTSGPANHREFTFVRGIYSDGGRGLFGFRRGGDWLGDGGPAWSIDYPDADHHMMLVARRLSSLDACEYGQPMSFADPDLRRFPFVYSLEWGNADLTDAEVQGLRNYLTRGGFLMIDDFWGTAEWANFERQMRRVFPDRPIIDIPQNHLLFRSYYVIDRIIQVPNAGNGRAIGRGMPEAGTWERDGYDPYVRGIEGDDGRLMVVIYWNTDLGDAMEWAEDPYYPLEFSKYASQIFLNTIIYAMTQ